MNQTQNLFAQVSDSLEFPATGEEVIQELEGREVESPHGKVEASEIGQVIDTDSTVRTPGELWELLSSSLPEEFIGRKHYDDRGGIHRGPSSEYSW